MATYSLKLNRTKLQGVGMKRAKSLVTRVTRQTFNRSQALVPVDNGVLRASGSPSVNVQAAQVVGTIIYTAEYAAAVHNGRRALTIKAKTRVDGRQGRLKFTVGGKVVYARQVHQPARAPRPYLGRALREVAGSAQDFTVTMG